MIAMPMWAPTAWPSWIPYPSKVTLRPNPSAIYGNFARIVSKTVRSLLLTVAVANLEAVSRIDRWIDTRRREAFADDEGKWLP